MMFVMITGLIISVVYALNSMSKIGDELVSIAEEDIPFTTLVASITIHQLEQAVNFERAIHYGSVMHVEPSAKNKYNSAIDKFNGFSKKLTEEFNIGKALAKKIIAGTDNKAQQAEFDHVLKMLSKIEK